MGLPPPTFGVNLGLPWCHCGRRRRLGAGPKPAGEEDDRRTPLVGGLTQAVQTVRRCCKLRDLNPWHRSKKKTTRAKAVTKTRNKTRRPWGPRRLDALWPRIAAAASRHSAASHPFLFAEEKKKNGTFKFVHLFGRALRMLVTCNWNKSPVIPPILRDNDC